MGAPERSSTGDSRSQARRLAGRIALAYIAVAALWIVFSDRLLLAVSIDPHLLGYLQTLKGWGFVLVTGLLLFEIMRRRLTATFAAQESLQRSLEMQTRLSTILEATSDFVGMTDIDGRAIYINRSGRRLLGLAGEEDITGLRISDCHPAWAAEVIIRQGLPAARREGTWRGDTALVAGDGREIPVSQVIIVHRDAAGCVSHISTIMRDISDRQQAEAELRLRHRAIEASSNGIVILDASRPEVPIIYANPALARITGDPVEAIVGRSLEFLASLDRRQEGCEGIRTALRLGRETRTVLRSDRPDGSTFWSEIFLSPVRDRDGRTTHFVCVLNDVTERRQYEEQLQHQSTHDPLTGLANRLLLLDRIGQTVHYANRSQRLVAVLLIDLDRFKVVNDSLGHSAGDELLRSISRRLTESVREGDTVARLGGDEFVITLAEVAKVDDVALLVQRFQDAIAEPHRVSGREIRVSASIGISLFPRDGSEGEELLRHADIAMYRAKEEGGATFRFFAPEMNLRVQEKLEMEADLRRALDRGELFLHYQPKVDLASGRISGCEALVRWRHPRRGVIPPTLFIPLAEETGLILPLGEWVLATACRQAQAWREAGLPALTMAVNLSPCQFRQPDLAERIAAIFTDCRFDPGCLDLELTESLLLRDPEGAAATAGKLKSLGVGIFLDDFGTGFSSLNYLRHFPVDGLKVDRSFIADIVATPGPGGGVLATSIIAIAHSLQLAAVAEGVETREQLDFLSRSGCDAYQGYLFSPPLPPEEFSRLLHSYRPDAEDTLVSVSLRSDH